MTHPRSPLHAIAIAALFGVALGAHAATSPESTTPAAPDAKPAATHAVAHHPVHHPYHHVAAPTPVRWIEGDAAAQARLSSGIARGTVTPGEVASLETRAADLYRDQADALSAPLTRASESEVAAAERGFTHAVDHAVWTKTQTGHEDPMDRMHERVASARDAEQQRWIANGLDHHRLAPTQVAALERTQADLVSTQAGMAREGHESVDAALRMQHQQDIQDWSIRTAHVDLSTSA